MHKLFLSSAVWEEELQMAVEVKLQKEGNNGQRMRVKDKRRTKEARKGKEGERRSQRYRAVLFVLA